MKKICIIGHFGFGKNLLNGQTIKTKIVTAEIEKQFGKNNIILLDLAGSWKRIPRLLLRIPFVLCQCGNFTIMPVENGLRFLVPLFNFWNRFFKRKIHYVVIGGWLAGFLKEKASLAKCLKKFDGIYVETNTMKTALEEMGFGNIFVMPNCKELKILEESELVYPKDEPYKLCTFSRVMKEKGIEDAINAVKSVNKAFGRNVYELDIYGQVDDGQTEWFENLKNSFPEYVRYCGCVDADKSVEILKNCFTLLFPTQFYTEGIPGTIIDAYAAGVPVISAKWESYPDVVDEGETGLGFEFGKKEQLTEILMRAANNPRALLDLKKNCIVKAENYIPETAIKVMTSRMKGE